MSIYTGKLVYLKINHKNRALNVSKSVVNRKLEWFWKNQFDVEFFYRNQ